MMKSPWTDNDKAFAPMFTESIIVSGQRGQDTFRQTIETAIFVDMTGDALAESNVDTDREDINVVFNQKDYAFVQKLLRGDLIERTMMNGIKYKIQEVKHDSLMGWVVKARSV